MPEKKPKKPSEMTTKEAADRLFDPRVLSHVVSAVAADAPVAKSKRKSTKR